MKKNPSRREFVKTSALLTGGLLAPSFLIPGAYAAPQNHLKLAVIGCGGRGTGAVFQAFDTGHPIKLVAMADANVKIPMAGTTGSLNVSVATGILLFERLRQLRGNG